MTVVALLVFPLRGKEGDEKDGAESAVYSSNATKIRNSRGRRFVIIPIMQQPHHFSRLKEDVKTIRIGVPFVGCGWSVVGCQRENRKPPSSLFEIRWFVFCEEGEEGHVMERDNRQTWWLWSDASEGQAPSSSTESWIKGPSATVTKKTSPRSRFVFESTKSTTETQNSSPTATSVFVPLLPPART